MSDWGLSSNHGVAYDIYIVATSQHLYSHRWYIASYLAVRT